MATEYRFYKIGEANNEIKRLEQLLKDTESKLSATAENDSEVAAQAEALRKERDSLLTENASLKEQLAKANTDRDAAQASAKAANDKVADFDKRVTEAASKEAQRIVASVGGKPLKAELPENPSTTQAGNNRSAEARKAKFIENIKAVRAAF